MKIPAAGACALSILMLLAGCEVGVEQPSHDAGQRQHSAGGPRRLQDSGASGVARGHLRFVEGYAQGYRQAIGQGKPMLLFFTAEWCHFCHQMADEAFTHPQVVGLSQHFVCILVDADAEPDVCRQFQVTGYPTIQFLSTRGVLLERMVGKKPGHQLMMAMQAALQTVARRSDDAEDPPAR